MSVRKVKTHGEAAGHGLIRDVNYTIVLSVDGSSVVCVTRTVTEDVGSELKDTDHTNVYGISILPNDLSEIPVTKAVPKEDATYFHALLIKLTSGYPPGVSGVPEVTTLIPVAKNDPALVITYHE